MESDKTVVQLCNELSRVTDCDGESVDEVDYLADLIVDAHKREVAKIVSNLDALELAVQEVCDADTLLKIIEKKKEFQNGK